MPTGKQRLSAPPAALLTQLAAPKCSFERPSAIQQRAIVPVIKGHDVIAQAQSGTGKTATFSISILQKVDPSIKGTQALILAPTRELAVQIQQECTKFGYVRFTLTTVGSTLIRLFQLQLAYPQHCHLRRCAQGPPDP